MPLSLIFGIENWEGMKIKYKILTSRKELHQSTGMGGNENNGNTNSYSGPSRGGLALSSFSGLFTCNTGTNLKCSKVILKNKNVAFICITIYAQLWIPTSMARLQWRIKDFDKGMRITILLLSSSSLFTLSPFSFSSTMTSSKKVLPNDCDNDRQPEIAIWLPKPEILYFS